MENIYYEGWEQELVYKFLPYDRCKKRAYICSPLSADTNEGIAQNMQAARAYMFYAMKRMGMNASAPHAYLPMILCDNIPSDRALALQFGPGTAERQRYSVDMWKSDQQWDAWGSRPCNPPEDANDCF